MKESERKRIIKNIQNDIAEKESLPNKHEQVKELEKNPIVAEYLKLLEDIKQIEDNLDYYLSPIDGKMRDSLEERINKGFSWARCSCEHDIWLYEGSYYKFTNHENETDYSRYFSENLGWSCIREKFSHNVYRCLECNKTIKTSDWEKFENTHLTLRIPNERLDIDYYRNFYYQLLYANTVKQSQKALIKEFKKNNEKVLCKK